MSTDDETSPSQTAPTSNDSWISGLNCSHAGRKFLEHVSHAKAFYTIRPSPPFQQAAAFRRTFIFALSKKPRPFGLPHLPNNKLPKYLAIVNFSGEKFFLHSENPCMVLWLTRGSPGCQQIIENAQNSPESERLSVLLVYSLPFQAGFDAAFWECRTLERTAEGEVVDDALACSVYDTCTASACTKTMAAETSDPRIVEAQEAAFERTMKACDLDVMVDGDATEKQDGAIGAIGAIGESDGKQKLFQMITLLQNERRKMIASHKQELEEIQQQTSEQTTRTLATIRETNRQQVKMDEVNGERITKLETTIKKMTAEIAQKDREIQQSKSDALLKEETKACDTKGLHSALVEERAASEKLRLQIKKLAADKNTSMKSQEQAHQKMHDTSERKLQKLKHEVEKTKESLRVAIELSVEREGSYEMSVAKRVAAEAAMTQSRSAVIAYRLRLGAARGRVESLDLLLKQARMAHVEAEEKSSGFEAKVNVLKTELERVEQELETAKSAKSAKTETETTKPEPAKEKTTTATAATTATTTATTKATIAVQTDILQETLRLGELEAEGVRLRDEVADLKLKLVEAERLRKKESKKAPPASFLTSESSKTGVTSKAERTEKVEKTIVEDPAPTPKFATGGGDANLETIIRQLHTSLHTITEAARMKHQFERSAHDAMTRLDAIANHTNHTNHMPASPGVPTMAMPPPPPPGGQFTDYNGGYRQPISMDCGFRGSNMMYSNEPRMYS